MKTFGWIVVTVAAVLFGYLVHHLAVARRMQAAPVAYEVSADSIQVYQERIAQIEARAAQFREEYKTSSPVHKLVIGRQLDLLDRRIRDLKVAVEQWKASRDQASGGNLHTKCVLLYGQVSGVCDALEENRAVGK